MKRFQIDLNLDDEQELEEFLAKYEPMRERKLANMLGFKGKFCCHAASALMNYAQNKRAAIGCRKSGDIQSALQYERICQNLYEGLIARFVDCW